MTDEARRLVDEQEEQKAAIERLAESTTNTSKRALGEAHDAIYGASTTSQQIATLTEQLARASEALNTTRGLAEQENADAARVHDAAVGALRDVESVRLPDVIPQELDDDAQNQRQESSQSLTEAQSKATANTQTLEDARAALAGAETDLNVARAEHEVNLCFETTPFTPRCCSKQLPLNVMLRQCAIVQPTPLTRPLERGIELRARWMHSQVSWR